MFRKDMTTIQIVVPGGFPEDFKLTGREMKVADLAAALIAQGDVLFLDEIEEERSMLGIRTRVRLTLAVRMQPQYVASTAESDRP